MYIYKGSRGCFCCEGGDRVFCSDGGYYCDDCVVIGLFCCSICNIGEEVENVGWRKWSLGEMKKRGFDGDF